MVLQYFDIEFTCPECEQVQHIEGIINTILSIIMEAGWPICPECGSDMDFCVN